MRVFLFILVFATFLTVKPLSAQESVVIDLNDKPKLFSESDYKALLECTVEKNSDSTHRYAEYHLNRRDFQTPVENEIDPDSQLLMPVISDCYEFENGKAIPFSLDRLIGDWAKHHGIVDAGGVSNIEDFAACATRNTPGFVRGYVNVFRSNSQRKVKTLSMLIHGMTIPPCLIRGDDFEMNLKKLNKLFERELRATGGQS